MNQSSSQLILVTPPDQMRAAAAYGLPLAHMAYRLGNGPHLFRADASVSPRGGLMMIGEDQFDGKGDAAMFCREVLRECQAKNFSGVIFDPDSKPGSTLSRIIVTLGEQLPRRGLSFFLPEAYANYAQSAKLMVSSALSGGSLENRLTSLIDRYGAKRLALCLDRSAEDFYLPSPQGTGRRLSRDELHQRIEQLSPSVFFSNELCAHYFTYMSRTDGAHFILFDDVGSMQKKLLVSEQLGITHFLLFHQQLDDLLPDLLSKRTQRP